MNTSDLVTWSMALGAIAGVTLARLVDLVFRPSLAQFQAVAFHIIVFLLVLFLSGVAQELWPAMIGAPLHFAQVLAGPVCVGLSNFWIRGWLDAAQRDWLMSGVLRASALLLPLVGLVCLALPIPLQMPVAAGASLAGASVTVWLTVRAWLLGDRLAPAMAFGCVLTLPAIAGMYALAMRVPLGPVLNVLLALSAAVSNGLTGLALWRRDRHEWRVRSEDFLVSQFDPVTKLYSGISLVKKLIKAQRRRRRMRRDGAVICILVFDVERLASQVGTGGINEMFICIASRIQRQVGVVNPVGRYYDRCFVTLVETIHSPAWLRTLGLRVSSSLRRPMEVMSATGERVEIRADIGVGVVHLERGPAAVEDILHDAQRMAEAARGMRSRAAILDPDSGDVVPVEQANLGPRRTGNPRFVPHAR